MEKEIYLVMSCTGSKYREAAKKGRKGEALLFWTDSTHLYACRDKAEAIEDCRWKNAEKGYMMYWTIKISMYV